MRGSYIKIVEGIATYLDIMSDLFGSCKTSFDISSDIKSRLLRACQTHTTISSSFVFPLIQLLVSDRKHHEFCLDLINIVSQSQKTTKSIIDLSMKKTLAAIPRTFYMNCLDRIKIPHKDRLVILLSAFDDEAYSVRFEAGRLVAMYAINQPNGGHITSKTCRFDTKVPKEAFGLMVKLVVDYGLFVIEGAGSGVRENESFRIMAFHMINHILVTCPFVGDQGVRKYIAWSFKALKSRIGGGLDMRRGIAHVVCGMIKGSNGDVAVLKSAVALFKALRNDESWSVRIVVLEFFKEVIGVTEGRPLVYGNLT